MRPNTKILMIVSALVMGVMGVAASFLPNEILAYTGMPATEFSPIAVQLMGALYLGFAIMNWMSKGIIIGGIYARPLALGNFLHFGVGALALIKGASAHDIKLFWAAVVIYGVFALLFGIVLFTHPLNEKT
jgi:hypothetical protein